MKGRRWLWIFGLLLVALAYYGSYFRHGINFQDEGGTLTLQSQRLLNGELPFKDVNLGYNVGWFYPLVGLFKVVGVNFVALRIFFFALSALAAVLGALTVEKAARLAGLRGAAVWLGLGVGVLLVVMPGMTFKNYNPLAVVANGWCLLGFVMATRERWRWALGGGFILGATWLVRIDLGTFLSVLWLGVIALRVFESGARLRAFTVSVLLLVGGVAVMHAPVFVDANRRGFGEDLASSYTATWRRMAGTVGIRLPSPKPSGALGVIMAEVPAVKVSTFGGKSRTTWNDVASAEDKKYWNTLGLFVLTYAPLLSLLLLALWALARWVRAHIEGRDSRLALAALALVGAALTLFPQFFIWRPDAPHLSEFGPGYWVAAVGAFVLLGADGNRWRMPSRILAEYLVVLCAVWVCRILPDRWCGTIAARENRKTYFEGENGVHVYEQKKTVAWMREAHRVIRENSEESDLLFAWPYHPSFNVLANRLSTERELYTDDLTAGPNWNPKAIARIELRKPRIIVVSHWDVNGTESSRFKNWGAATYAHIQGNYELLGTYDEKEQFEVWKRKP